MKQESVDDYIAGVPTSVQEKLKELRALIKRAAPKAKEKISYGMPYYEYKGRLAYFQLWKNHLGLYIPSPIIEQHKEELKKYETTEATVRLPLDKRLPVSLIIKLIKARVKRNDELIKNKRSQIFQSEQK